jgi:hypothetical protein
MTTPGGTEPSGQPQPETTALNATCAGIHPAAVLASFGRKDLAHRRTTPRLFGESLANVKGGTTFSQR